jgi:hypothetical protein
LRRESSQVTILERDNSTQSISLFDRTSGTVSTRTDARSESALAIIVLMTAYESARLVLRHRGRSVLTVRTAKGLLTHVTLESHVVSTAHRALVSTVSSHTLTGSRTVHVIHPVVMHVRVPAHVTRVRVVTATSTTMVAVVAVIAVVTMAAVSTVAVTVVVHAEVHHALLSLVATGTTATCSGTSTDASTAIVIVMAVLFTLQLGLDTLAVRGVSDHGQDRSDVVDQGHSLGWVCVV